jgi:predicted nucleotidyltransferase
MEIEKIFRIEEILFQKDTNFNEQLKELFEYLPNFLNIPSEQISFQVDFSDNIIIPSKDIDTNGEKVYPMEFNNKVFGILKVVANDSQVLENKSNQNIFKFLAKKIAEALWLREIENIEQEVSKNNDNKAKWNQIVELLSNVDPYLLSVLSHKMLNFLLCKGYREAKQLSYEIGHWGTDNGHSFIETNTLSDKKIFKNTQAYSKDIFELSSKFFSDEQILYFIQKWIFEEKSSHLVRLLANESIPLKEISDAIRKYYFQTPNLVELETRFALSPAVQGIRVALSRRLLSDQLEYVHIAKNFVKIKDFYELLQRTIITSEGIGRFGGKAAGIILASKIIQNFIEEHKTLVEQESMFSLKKIKIPKTWFIPSDSFYDFLYYNNLEDIIEQKYKPIEEIRSEYPNIIQVFKNSQFPPELVNGLSRALDDFGENPIIVRSSSLLEDRLGASFPGKYKSIFLANQGTKQERLNAVMDAIAEVYASTFSPEPIGYRIEHHLLDFNEEMGIMIQEVVGKKYGNYFFPAFAGVAFSLNDYRWSPRIEREDGLVRLVVGLGTRAVDRLGDDYCFIASIGKPELSVYANTEDYLKYSPKKMDVINLSTNSFETIEIDKLVKILGYDFPMLNYIFSIVEHNYIRRPVGLGINPDVDEIVVTFQNLISQTNFPETLQRILKILQKELNIPVDIEFAFDGENLYLLQCRSQSTLNEFANAELPTKISEEDILFKSKKFISGGKSPDIEYIVFVDPINYSRINNPQDFYDIASAIDKLNQKLPPKKFILIGPGRWGTRDDFRLGVKVNYSSINNTAALVELAYSIGNYAPEVSFGTHFFQDLVESNIKYIPIFPQEEDTIFNEHFLLKSQNLLPEFLPEYSHILHLLKVISVPKETSGKTLRIFNNTELGISFGIFSESSISPVYFVNTPRDISKLKIEEPWEIRWKFVEKMVSKLNPSKFGIKGIYLYGTVFTKSASDTSDVDILVHYDGNPRNKELMEAWFEPWNFLLQDIIYINTGFRRPKPLDVHYITDSELVEENYYFREIMKKPKENSCKLI